MLTQIEGYFRAGQPTRYLPRSSTQLSYPRRLHDGPEWGHNRPICPQARNDPTGSIPSFVAARTKDRFLWRF
jgi:hypothetical protein